MAIRLHAGTQQRSSFGETIAPTLWSLAGLVAFGTAGYVAIEGWRVLDGLYMAVITLTTVGFGETHPLSDAGRLFTILYLVTGLGLAGRGLSDMARYMSDGRMTSDVAARRARRELRTMKDHFIVVGYGRLGREIVADLLHHGERLVVVDIDELPGGVPEGVVQIVGDATQDETLLQAGLMEARGIAVATPSDAVNVFVTLSARQLASDVFIHTRVEEEASAVKARRAGANGVLLPYLLGGTRVSQALLRPRSSDFVEHLTQRHFNDLAIDDVTVTEGRGLEGTLAELRLRSRFGVIVVALQKCSDDGLVTPSADTLVELGDTLVVVGAPDVVAAFVRGDAPPLV